MAGGIRRAGASRPRCLPRSFPSGGHAGHSYTARRARTRHSRTLHPLLQRRASRTPFGSERKTWFRTSWSVGVSLSMMFPANCSLTRANPTFLAAGKAFNWTTVRGVGERVTASPSSARDLRPRLGARRGPCLLLACRSGRFTGQAMRCSRVLGSSSGEWSELNRPAAGGLLHPRLFRGH